MDREHTVEERVIYLSKYLLQICFFCSSIISKIYLSIGSFMAPRGQGNLNLSSITSRMASHLFSGTFVLVINRSNVSSSSWQSQKSPQRWARSPKSKKSIKFLHIWISYSSHILISIKGLINMGTVGTAAPTDF